MTNNNKYYYFYLPIGNFVCKLSIDDQKCFQVIKKAYREHSITKRVSWTVYIIKNSNNIHSVFNEPILGNEKIIKLNSVYFSSEFINRKKHKAQFNYYLQTYFTKRFLFTLKCLLVDLFIDKKILLLHASGVKKENEVLVFTGSAKRGKSTISRLTKLPILADDGIIIRKIGKNYYAYSSPFEKQYLKSQSSFHKIRLGKIYILHKSKYNDKIPLSIPVAVAKLYLNLLINKWAIIKNKGLWKELFNIVVDLNENVGIYSLYFNKDPNYLVHL